MTERAVREEDVIPGVLLDREGVLLDRLLEVPLLEELVGLGFELLGLCKLLRSRLRDTRRGITVIRVAHPSLARTPFSLQPSLAILAPQSSRHASL